MDCSDGDHTTSIGPQMTLAYSKGGVKNDWENPKHLKIKSTTAPISQPPILHGLACK